MTLQPANSPLEGKIQTFDFHLFPKIHKAKNPGRLLPTAWGKETKTYVKHTTDFIKKIEAIDHVSDESYSVFSDLWVFLY